MTDHEPIEINGETFEPVVVPCPGETGGGEHTTPCEEPINVQAVLLGDGCPHCGSSPKELVYATEMEAPPEDYDPESYKLEA